MARKALTTPQQFRRQVQPQLRTLREKVTNSEQAAARLRAYHQIGTVVAGVVPGTTVYGENRFAELAEAIGRQASWLHKLRAFAKGYTKRDLNELCKLAEYVSWSHVVLLLSVDNKQKRAALQRQIEKNAWSKEDLRRAMKAQAVERHAGGRPLSRQKDPQAGLRQLVEECEHWLRLCREVWVADGESLVGQLEAIPKSRNTGKLQKQVASASDVLGQLKSECVKLQRRLQAL